MSQLTLTVEQAGQRADQFLTQSVESLTRSGAQKLLEQGLVTVNGKSAKKNTKFSAGDTVTVQLPEPEPVEVLPQDIPLDVVYEDQDVIVVNKPVGMVVHRPRSPGRHPGQRPALRLRRLPLGHQRPAAAGHRPPHRPGYQRAHHRGEKRHGSPEPVRAAPRPLVGPHL